MMTDEDEKGGPAGPAEAVQTRDGYVPGPVGSAADPAGMFDNVYVRMLIIADRPSRVSVEDVPWDPAYMLGVLKAPSLMAFPAAVGGRRFTLIGAEVPDVSGLMPTVFCPDGRTVLLMGPVMLAGPCAPGGIPAGLTDADLVFLRPHVQMLRIVLPGADGGRAKPVTAWGLTGCVSLRKPVPEGGVPPIVPVTEL